MVAQEPDASAAMIKRFSPDVKRVSGLAEENKKLY